MKKLKFMLAAATAIGLASATQADQYNTTGFEKLARGTAVTTGVLDNDASSYFYYAGANAEDNESVIAAGTPDIARPRGAANVDPTRTNILQVSTGTDPLLRTYEPCQGAGNAATPQAPTTITSDTYVDTLVQFTVTPYTDTVTPSAADKLMIYLKESVTTNEFGEITAATTNLVAVGGYYSASTTAKEYVLDTGAIEVLPNVWHRLTVKAVVDLSGTEGLGFPGFQIWVDGVLCTLANGALTYNAEDSETADLFASFQFSEQINEGKYILSLQAGTGEATATLQGVGFAGEGKVDDIVFSTLDPFATVYDFTFAFDPQKVSAVTYTVGGQSYDQARTFPEVEAGTQVQITSVTYADAWLEGTRDAVNLSDPVSGVYTVTNAGASLTITPAVFFPRTNTADQDGSAAHPYEVADAAALSALQKGVLAGKNLTGVNFVQTGNIDMTGVTDFYGIGWFKSSTAYLSLPDGVTATMKDNKPNSTTDLPFTGVYDGAGYTISNVTLVRHNYAGLFNCVEGTVKNLTVQNLGFNDVATASADGGELEWGCGIVGNAQGNAVLANLTSAGTVWGNTANHNIGGIAARAEDNATITGCVNNVNIASASKRLGGIVAFTGTTAASDTVTIVDCTNNGNLSSTDGTRGVGGILSSPETGAGANTVIKGCTNTGTLTAGSSGFTGWMVGSLGVNTSSSYTDAGGNTFLASGNMLGTRGSNTRAIEGLAYAKDAGIDGMNYLTTVPAADLAAGNTYTLMADIPASETPVFALAVGETIAFDTVRGFTFAGTIVGNPAIGVRIDSETVGTVTTYTGAQLTAPSTELEPGEKQSFGDTEPTQQQLEAITIVASDAVSNALQSAGASIATYEGLFETVAVQEGGVWYAEVVMKASTTNTLQGEVNAGVAAVVDGLESRSVLFDATPGFYYWINYGPTLSATLPYNTERVLATGSSVNITIPNDALGQDAQFFKVKVDYAPAPVAQP